MTEENEMILLMKELVEKVKNLEDAVYHKDNLLMKSGYVVEDTPPPPTTQQNTTQENSFEFSFTAPTEFVELPSKGRFYPENHPLHGQDSVEIRQMTAKDEDILTSKTLLKKGVAIDRLVANVLVDKRINPDDLLVGDKNALLVALRVSGYGSDYETNVTCPRCMTAVNFKFDLLEKAELIGNDFGPYDIIANDSGTFTITLPKTKAQVEVRLLTGHDEKRLMARAKNKQKHNLPEAPLTDVMELYIVSVNGSDAPQVKGSLIANMPAIDARYLRNAYKSVVPNFELVQDFACVECDYEQEMEVPFTADFFWPKS